MSTKAMYTVTEDKQEIQKQLGCMNGIFQLFDRRYLLGQRRHDNHPTKLPQGNVKEFTNAPDKPKEKTPNKFVKEKHRVSVESSRNSFSSSCSSLDCSKRVQTEVSSFCPSIVSEPSSPTLHKKQDLSVLSADIKDVVKESMTRKPRVVPVKTVAKEERKGPAMTHVDSPRPLQQQPKLVPYERKDQNLAKHREVLISRGIKEAKETSRLSYDGRESPYKQKSIANIKERPRLSLDSKQSSIKNRTIVIDDSGTHEPGSNKRPTSSVVARLMGLEDEALKIKPCLDDEIISISKKDNESKCSTRVSNVLTRIPLEPAPWKQEVRAHNNASERADHGQSIYGQIEKRLTDVEFKTSGKDLRALKQILEAIQRTKMNLEKTEHQESVQPVAIKPVIKNVQKSKKVNVRTGRQVTRNVTPIATKATGRTKNSMSPEYQTRENYCNSRNSRSVSPRLQRSKNGAEKQSVNGVRNKTNGQLTVLNIHTRSLSQQGDTLSFPSESDASIGSQNEPEVTSRENKQIYSERMMGYKPMAELAMLAIEQPSPVSVLDAFYTEDAPSPIQKTSYAFKEDEDLCFDEREWSQVGIDNFPTSTERNQSNSGFNHINLENIKHLVHQIQLINSIDDDDIITPHESTNEENGYVKEILLASGILKNLDCATTIVDLHPTSSLINPELFKILEKNKECTSKNEKLRRKMIFDTVDNLLVEKLATSTSSRLTSKTKAKTLNAEKLLEEVCIEIDNFESNTSGGIYDNIINIIDEGVNKKSEDWNNCSEVPSIVLDIECLIFKDLISEIVNGEIGGPQEGYGHRRRQLFLM
ncbi:protein LONGIFOLIA 1-like [Rutidosis leptorrhynchoides]|uniref:protein LONGIFOLIA 1-like n=1 Tax=Rutidosis leptorrhynchoides TaxID=125765 RepID=UPI003A99B634